jgi:hypothetical protein
MIYTAPATPITLSWLEAKEAGPEYEGGGITAPQKPGGIHDEPDVYQS